LINFDIYFYLVFFSIYYKKIILKNIFLSYIIYYLLFIKIKFFNFLIKFLDKWGLGIGDWGLGIGDWAQSPIPNPHYYSFKLIILFISKIIKRKYNCLNRVNKLRIIKFQ